MPHTPRLRSSLPFFLEPSTVTALLAVTLSMVESSNRLGSVLAALVTDPLQGKTSLSRVFWIYGALGSVVVSALGLFIDAASAVTLNVYWLLSLMFSLYVTIATYRCAGNCRSPLMTRLVRVSTLASVILILPLFAYLYFTGALAALLSLMPGEQ